MAATGPGNIIINVIDPTGNPLGDAEFIEGQAKGTYDVQFQLQTTPSEQEAFGPGTYLVQLAVCEGDCTHEHPYSGIYAQAATSFKITGSI